MGLILWYLQRTIEKSEYTPRSGVGSWCRAFCDLRSKYTPRSGVDSVPWAEGEVSGAYTPHGGVDSVGTVYFSLAIDIYHTQWG